MNKCATLCASGMVMDLLACEPNRDTAAAAVLDHYNGDLAGFARLLSTILLRKDRQAVEELYRAIDSVAEAKWPDHECARACSEDQRDFAAHFARV